MVRLLQRKWQSLKDGQNTFSNYFKVTGGTNKKPAKHRWTKDLKLEARAATKKIKRNKAKGPDDVVTDMLQVLGDFGTVKLTKVANAIYDTGKIPYNHLNSIVIPLPKKVRYYKM